jgi:hypothetical protein
MGRPSNQELAVALDSTYLNNQHLSNENEKLKQENLSQLKKKENEGQQKVAEEARQKKARESEALPVASNRPNSIWKSWS